MVWILKLQTRYTIYNVSTSRIFYMGCYSLACFDLNSKLSTPFNWRKLLYIIPHPCLLQTWNNAGRKLLYITPHPCLLQTWNNAELYCITPGRKKGLCSVIVKLFYMRSLIVSQECHSALKTDYHVQINIAKTDSV